MDQVTSFLASYKDGALPSTSLGASGVTFTSKQGTVSQFVAHRKKGPTKT